MILTIKQIQDGDYTLDQIRSEDDYNKVWTILRMTIDELERIHGDIHERRRLNKLMHELIELHTEKTKLKCSVCGKDASWNTPFLVEGTPHIVEDKGKFSIVCSTCARVDTSGRLFTGIEQRSDWRGALRYSRNQEYLRNGCMLVFYQNTHGGWTEGAYSYKGRYLTFCHPMPSVYAWINGGQTMFPLTTEEKMVALENPLNMLVAMEATTKAGMFRCTFCGKVFKESECAGHPLFAGKVCGECWKIHLEKLDDERKRGHVCSLCGQPYSNCCC